MKKYLKPLLVALPLGLGTTAASAVEVYGTAGFLGYGLGVAQPLGPHLGVRADIATAGNRSERRTEEGIDYDAKVKLDRTNLLLDWFVMGGTFRVSTGLTFANTKLVLDASGAGGTLNVGGNNYTTTAADGFNVSVKYPSTMPYLGIGWGHNMQRDKGWRFAFERRRGDRQAEGERDHARPAFTSRGAGRRGPRDAGAARWRRCGEAAAAGDVLDRLQLLIRGPAGRPRPVCPTYWRASSKASWSTVALAFLRPGYDSHVIARFSSRTT